jgi:hypothetical protein
MQEKFVLRTLKKIAAISTGVIMAGATITGALALDLADYPSPFVADGVYDDANALVVGDSANAADTLGLVDIASNLQYESKTAVTSDSTSVSVEGGITKQVPLGVALAADTFFDTQMQDDEVSSLLDTEITFGSTAYDVSEELNISASGPRIINSLGTSSDDDYTSNIFMDVQQKDYIKFYYTFDESVNISSATSTTPLEIDFCGQHFKITSFLLGQATAGTSFTAYVGESHYLVVGESVSVDGSTITLLDVGSTSVVVDVDGTEEIISTTTAETVSGIEIAVDEVFSRTEKEDSSASLVIGDDATKTYTDGDAFAGENEDDPNWVWDLASLTTVGTSQKFGIENDFVFNDYSDDGLPAVGDCITLPNDYVEICLDSLSVGDEDYATYTFEIDEGLDASDLITSNTSLDAIYIHSDASEGLELRQYNAHGNNASIINETSTVKVEDVWLYYVEGWNYTAPGIQNVASANAQGLINVFYEDSNNKLQFFGAVPNNGSQYEILRLNYENTKNTNVVLKTGHTTAVGSSLNLTLDIQPDVTTDMISTKENMTMTFAVTNDVTHLGATADTEEAGEFMWTSTNMGTKDEDHRSYYGIIIKDPKGSGASDQVELQVPNDQVFANVVVKGTSTTVSSGTTTYVPAEVTPATMLASEVSSATDYNLILVGGPCANDLVESVFDMTCDGWAYETGEAVVKLAENGDNVALLVAGSSADDTRRAARAVANYGDYDFSGAEVMVTGSSLEDIEVGAMPEETEEAEEAEEEVAEEAEEEVAEEAEEVTE